MQVGFYNKHPIDFSSYRVSNFQWPVHRGVSGGCGANALSVITGIDSLKIHSLHNYRRDFPDNSMIKFLKKRKYTVIPLTMCSVSDHRSVFDVQNVIKADHVLLISQLYQKNEGSWIVVHNGQLMHNFSLETVYPLEFVNRPILTAYVVYHPKWNKFSKKEKRKEK